MYCKILFRKIQDERHNRERDAWKEEFERIQKLYSNEELQNKITYSNNDLLSTLRVYLNQRDMIINVLGSDNLMFQTFERCRDLYMAGDLDGARFASDALRDSKSYHLMVALSLPQSGFIPTFTTSCYIYWIKTESPYNSLKTAAIINQEMCTILRLIEKNMAKHNKPTHFDIVTNDKYDFAGKTVVVREFYEAYFEKRSHFDSVKKYV